MHKDGVFISFTHYFIVYLVGQEWGTPIQTVIFHAHGYPGIRDDHVCTGYLVNVTSDGNGGTGFSGPSAGSLHKIGFRLEIGGGDNTDV